MKVWLLKVATEYYGDLRGEPVIEVFSTEEAAYFAAAEYIELSPHRYSDESLIAIKEGNYRKAVEIENSTYLDGQVSPNDYAEDFPSRGSGCEMKTRSERLMPNGKEERSMVKRVYILSGISGSGKSFLAEEILQRTQGVKVSADHFFMQNGEYLFDPKKLGEAHADCFRRFIHYLEKTWLDIVVDNTNCTAIEIAPYYQAANAFNALPEILTIRCGQWNEVEWCARRNVHKVPADAVYAQHNRLEDRVLPPYWKNTVQWAKFR
jgi:hypothetical protein